MTIQFLPPTLDRYDAAIEDAIATCNGDLHGAVKALMLVNEVLESQLEELKSAMGTDATLARRTDRSLH